MKNYTGGCHCSAVRYEVNADLATIIECNCSHCRIKGLVLTFVPASAFTLVSGEESLTEYRFNKKMLAHLFCRVCGVQPIARGTNESGEETVAVNVRTMDGVELETLTITPFNGKEY